MLQFLGWVFDAFSVLAPIIQFFDLAETNVSPLFPALPLFVSGVIFISLHKILASIQTIGIKKPSSSPLPQKNNNAASTDFEGIPRKQGESDNDYWKRVSTETDLNL